MSIDDPKSSFEFVARAPAADRPALIALHERLRDLQRNGRSAKLTSRSGKPIELPLSVLTALGVIVEDLARGGATVLSPLGGDLADWQAAKFLGVPVVTFDRMLDRGDIPFRTVDGERLLALDDVLAWRTERSRQSRQGLDRLARLSQDEED